MLPDTKYFGGKTIDNCDISACSESERYCIKKYASVASILFIPFRDKNSLTDENGCYLQKFQLFLSDPPAKFIDLHMNLLKNIQDCHNSFNCGRPKDALEQVTTKPEATPTNAEVTNNHTDDHIINMYDCLINNVQNDVIQNICFRSNDDTLSMEKHIQEIWDVTNVAVRY